MVKYLSSMLNFGVNPNYYKKYEECNPILNCKITLRNNELWKKFHSLGTEMIITKSGRRMFPSLHVQVKNLSPSASYCVLLEMIPSSQNRYKYSSSGGWFPAGTEEAQSPHRVYLHPDSPASGNYWMSQPISFGRLKLTNTVAPPEGQVVLSSMHKYQPRIIIAEASDPQDIAWAPSASVVFPETEFIAVTAYQNEKITKLKIDNNPFAKGFRENGQAKSKRKKIEAEKSLQFIDSSTASSEDRSSTPNKYSQESLSSMSATSTPQFCQRRYSFSSSEHAISSTSLDVNQYSNCALCINNSKEDSLLTDSNQQPIDCSMDRLKSPSLELDISSSCVEFSGSKSVDLKVKEEFTPRSSLEPCPISLNEEIKLEDDFSRGSTSSFSSMTLPEFSQSSHNSTQPELFKIKEDYEDFNQHKRKRSPLSPLEVSKKPRSLAYSTEVYPSYSSMPPFPYFIPHPYYSPSMWTHPFYSQCYPSPPKFYQSPCTSVNEELEVRPKKLTDFSIRAITGCK